MPTTAAQPSDQPTTYVIPLRISVRLRMYDRLSTEGRVGAPMADLLTSDGGDDQSRPPAVPCRSPLVDTVGASRERAASVWPEYSRSAVALVSGDTPSSHPTCVILGSGTAVWR
jgi:hypothetical protein